MASTHLARSGFIVGLSAVAAMALVSCASSGGSPKASSARSYQVAFIADLTGIAQTGGTSSQSGFTAAVARLNKSGGINGHKIVVTTYDAQSTPATAASQTIRATSSKPDIIFDAVQSSELAATLGTLQSAAIPTVAIALDPTALGPPPAPWYYLITPDGGQSGLEMVNGAKADLGVGSLAGKHIAIDEYGTPAVATYVAAIKQEVSAEGGTVVADITDPITSLLTSWSSQAAQVAAAKPNIVLMLQNPTNVPIVVNALRTAGVTVPILGNEGSSDSATLQALKSQDYSAVRSSTVTPFLRQWANVAGFAQNENGVYSGKGWIAGELVAAALNACSDNTCSAAPMEKALRAPKGVEIPGDVSIGPVTFTSARHAGVSSARLFHWDTSTNSLQAYGPVFSVNS